MKVKKDRNEEDLCGICQKHEPTNGKTMKCSTCEMISYLVLVSIWVVCYWWRVY